MLPALCLCVCHRSSVGMSDDDWAPPASDEECVAASTLGGLPQQPLAARPSKLQEPAAPSAPALAAHAHGRGRGGKLRSALKKRAAVAKPGPHKARRQLKRRLSDGKPDEPVAKMMICIWGGSMKRPSVVGPVWKELDSMWMSPNEAWYWLRRACTRQGDPKDGMTHYRHLFQSAISALRRELQDGMKQAMSAACPTSEVRAALGLEEDDLEIGDQGGAVGVGQKAKRGKQPKPQVRPTTVDVMLGDTKVRIQTKVRPLKMEVTEASVNAVIEWCRQHIKAGKLSLKKQSSTPAACPRGTWSMPADPCPPIQGKVTWQPSHSSWCIHARDENKQKFIARLKVEVTKRTQGFLQSGGMPPTKDGAKAAFAKARRETYLAAINQWNMEDKSSRPRIEVADSAGGLLPRAGDDDSGSKDAPPGT